MKDIKKKIEFFTFYDKTGIEKHLEEMASEGWLLEKMSAFRWTYRRIEPKKIHFSVSYYATITDFEPEPTEEQQAFNEFCDHSGWKLATQTVQMQVFYNENENPVPIETDPMLEIENIHISVKKTVLVSYFLMLFLGFIMGTGFVSTMLGDPILLLSSASRLFTGIWSILALAYSLTELITYFAWRKKAKALAEQGIFLETRGHRKLGFSIVVFMLASIILYLISLADSGLQFYMTAYLLILLAGFPLVNGVKALLKKKKVKAGTNKALTFAASFVFAFALTGALTAVTVMGIKNDAFESDLKELQFTIGELLDDDVVKNPVCPLCGAKLKLSSKPLHSKGQRYSFRYFCEKDGEMILSLKLYRNFNETWRAKRTIDKASESRIAEFEDALLRTAVRRKSKRKSKAPKRKPMPKE